MNIEEARELYANTIVESYENSDKSRSFELFLADELNAVAASVGTNPKTVILNSRNSGTPTSQNPIGQPDWNNKVHSRNSRTVKGLTNNNPDKNERHGRNIKPSFSDDELDDTEYEGAERCSECGSEDFTQIDTVTRYVHKLIIATKKIKVEYGVFKCNDCGEEFTASMNDRTKYAGEDRSVYDSETEKMVLTLRDVGNMPFNKIVSVISGLTNNEMNLSEGYVNKVFCRASRQLIQFRDDLKKVAVQFPQIGWDDTGLDVDGTLMCARVYCNERFSLFFAHENKDLLGLLEDSILTCLTEEHKVMHDHAKQNYNEGFAFTNLECLSHFQRSLLLVYEKTEHLWAILLLELNSLADMYRNELQKEGIGEFSKHYLSSFKANFKEILDSAKKIHKTMRETDCGYKEEERLLNLINEFSTCLYMWMYDFSLATTNNESERSLRNGMKRSNKISGYAKNINRVDDKAIRMSYLETCKKNGISINEAIQRVVDGNPITVKEIFNTDDNLILPDGEGINIEKIEKQKELSKGYWATQLDKLKKRREVNQAKREARKKAKKRTILEKFNNRNDKFALSSSCAE